MEKFLELLMEIYNVPSIIIQMKNLKPKDMFNGTRSHFIQKPLILGNYSLAIVTTDLLCSLSCLKLIIFNSFTGKY